jgi:[calcium/calmodulin-dependent protein kinase] kinase
MREIAILKKIDHPHLVKLYVAIREESPPNNIFVILEYIEAGPIMTSVVSESGGPPSFINPLTKGILGEALASKCFRAVLSALSYLHLNNIAHRDLKPDNILVDFNWCVKVTDFGVSRQFTMPSSRGLCQDTAGTWPFWSPEMCDEDNDGTYGAYKADVWAAAICLWCFVYGALPFWGATPTDLFDIITRNIPVKPSHRSPELESMLDAMLRKDPEKRPTTQECEQFEWLQRHSSEATESALMRHNAQPLDRDLQEQEIENAFTPGEVKFSESINNKLRKWRRRASNSVQKRKSDLIKEHSRRLSFSYQSLQQEIARASHNNSYASLIASDDDDLLISGITDSFPYERGSRGNGKVRREIDHSLSVMMLDDIKLVDGDVDIDADADVVSTSSRQRFRLSFSQGSKPAHTPHKSMHAHTQSTDAKTPTGEASQRSMRSVVSSFSLRSVSQSNNGDRTPQSSPGFFGISQHDTSAKKERISSHHSDSNPKSTTVTIEKSDRCRCSIS